MSSGRNKDEVISFKVDFALAEALEKIDNRSDFIRNAVLSALGNICPLCSGKGTLTASQYEHWQEFSKHHSIVKCSDCNEQHIVCDRDSNEKE